MNDAQIDAFAAEIMSEHLGITAAQSGPYTSRLGDVLKQLRGLNIPWLKILQLLPAIITLLTTGKGDWLAVLAQILALFGISPPPPVNVP
jgi:hypothetical protein